MSVRLQQEENRIEAARSFLFDGQNGAEEDEAVDASAQMEGARQLVEARQRLLYWEGSDLEDLCKRSVDEQQFKEGSGPQPMDVN